MKKLFLFTIIIGCYFLSAETQAQIKTPAASPKAMVSQTIGLVEVAVEYSRPGVKDRTVFAKDGLVPFGKLWRTGANAATKITFSEDVKIQDQAVKAGSYALLSTPDQESWAIHLFKHESSRWNNYRDKDPEFTFKIRTETKRELTETMLISFNNLTSESGDLTIAWEKTKVTIPITVSTDETVMANIEDVMSGPSIDDYYRAGVYMFESGRDLEKALEMVQKATHSDDPKFWQIRREALILAKMGKYKPAIEAAKKSMSLAEKAENDDYVKMNRESIAEWSKK